MGKRGKKIFKITGIVIGSLVLFLALIAFVLYLVLTPQRLTPLVNKYSTQYLDATVTFSSVELSLFEELPYVSLRLRDGKVISHAFANEPDSLKALIPAGADSLLQFKELLVSLNLPSMMVGKVDIRRVRLVEPKAYAYIAPWGKASWEIYGAPDTTTTSESAPLAINIERIAIRNSGDLVYDSRPDSMKITADIGRLFLRGRLTDNLKEFSLKRARIADLSVSADLDANKTYARFAIDSMSFAEEAAHAYKVDFMSHATFKVDSVSYCTNLPLSAVGGFSLNGKDLVFDELKLSLADVAATLNGGFKMEKGMLFSDMKVAVKPTSVAGLLALVPDGMFPRLKALKTDLSFGFTALVDGVYNAETKTMPSVVLDVNIPGGAIRDPKNTSKIENILLDAQLTYNPEHLDSTRVLIRKMQVGGSTVSLEMSGEVSDVLGDPLVDGQVKGMVNLYKLSQLLDTAHVQKAQGKIGLDLKLNTRLSDLTPKRIGNAKIRGSVTADEVLIDSPKDTLHLLLDGGVFRFGAYENKRDSLIDQGKQMLRVGIKVDTANIVYKNRVSIIAADTRASVSSAASLVSDDKSVIHPLKGMFDTRRLQVATVDSMWIRVRDAKATFRILPSKENPAIPVIKLDMQSRALAFRDDVNRGNLSRSDISLEATINAPNKAVVARRERRLDSLQRVYPNVKRDSLMAYVRSQRRTGAPSDDLQEGDLDLAVDSSIASLIQRWNVSGVVKARGARLVTPYFPLRNRMRNLDISFNTNEVNLHNTTILSGSSKFDITGKIAGIKRVLMGRGKLKVDVTVNSDTLNINELIQAANAGVAYMESSPEYKESLAQAANEEQLQQLIDQNSTEAASSDLIIVPANLDMDVKLRVKYGQYAKLILDSVAAELIVRDRNLQIKELRAETDAGALALTAIYTTKSKEDISTGFDLELKDIEVAKLIDLIPEVDTLLPMLRSFEGFITCQIAATAEMDTTMNIILPTLQGVCRITGNDMVLLDGETFAEIAKMMKFKNREKNEIDRISVELIVKDNQIEVFPFVMQMDRYQTAISGVHKLDMDFKYHISVLQSPLPFRVGVNISGNTNDMDHLKFRIGKAKYKNATLPTYTALIDTTRINLRKHITDIFRYGVQAADIKNVGLVEKVGLVSVDDNELEELTAEDSLRLQKEGILEVEESQQQPLTAVDEAQDAVLKQEAALPQEKRKNKKKK